MILEMNLHISGFFRLMSLKSLKSLKFFLVRLRLHVFVMIFRCFLTFLFGQGNIAPAKISVSVLKGSLKDLIKSLAELAAFFLARHWGCSRH